jgi:hypothetical protein
MEGRSRRRRGGTLDGGAEPEAAHLGLVEQHAIVADLVT